MYKIDKGNDSKLSREVSDFEKSLCNFRLLIVFAFQIYFFSKQMLHCELNFTAFGFFDIDMTLFYSVSMNLLT